LGIFFIAPNLNTIFSTHFNLENNLDSYGLNLITVGIVYSSINIKSSSVYKKSFGLVPLINSSLLPYFIYLFLSDELIGYYFSNLDSASSYVIFSFSSTFLTSTNGYFLSSTNFLNISSYAEIGAC
jgi:hypothetical protein